MIEIEELLIRVEPAHLPDDLVLVLRCERNVHHHHVSVAYGYQLGEEIKRVAEDHLCVTVR